MLSEAARFRVRGRLASALDVHFGITTKKPGGGFGGKYEVVVPAASFDDPGEPFDVEIKLDVMRPQEPWRPSSVIGYELEDCYLYTVDEDAGLEVMRVELLPASPD